MPTVPVRLGTQITTCDKCGARIVRQDGISLDYATRGEFYEVQDKRGTEHYQPMSRHRCEANKTL